MAKREEYDWLEDPFDEAKNAQIQQELESARRRSLVLAIVAAVVVLLAVLFFALSCSAVTFLGDGLGV